MNVIKEYHAVNQEREGGKKTRVRLKDKKKVEAVLKIARQV